MAFATIRDVGKTQLKRSARALTKEDPVKMAQARAARVRLALEHSELDANEADRRANASTGYTSRLATAARRSPDAAIVRRLAGVMGVRYEWLMFGEGTMTHEANQTPPQVASFPSKPALDAVLLVHADEKERWSNSTVGAARSLAVDLPPKVWPDFLDRLEEALRPIVEKYRAHPQR